MTVLALAAAPGTSARAVPLLQLLGVGVDVVSLHVIDRDGGPAPDAILASAASVLPTLREHGHDAVPVAVYVHDDADLAAARAAGAAATWSDQPAMVAKGAVNVPRRGIDVTRWPPLAPLVRSRWRERHGLPADLVIGVDAPLDPHHAETPLALAAAAVVTGPLTLLALALGTPVVTNAATARRLGLRPGLDAEVARTPADAAALARTVAADDGRAAALSRRGRRFAELHLDLGAPARHLRQILGLEAAVAPGPAGALMARLDELDTPDGAPVRARAIAALDTFLVGASQ